MGAVGAAVKTQFKTHESIFDFSDYRAFLRSHGQRQRHRSRQWSYGVWARRLGLKGTASLTMVLNGQRDAGAEMIQKFLTYFQFSDRERRYFETLVELSKTKQSSDQKLLLIKRLQALSGRREFHILSAQELAVLSEWFHYPVRQMSRFAAFRDDSGWIQSQFRVPVKRTEIESSLRLLLKLGLLVRAENGSLTRGPLAIKTTEDIAQAAIKRFHEQMITHASTALHEVPIDEREFRALSVAVKRERIPEAKARLREYMTAFFEEFGSDEADRLYQLNFQLFPLSK